MWAQTADPIRTGRMEPRHPTLGKGEKMQRARAAIRRLYWIDAHLQNEACPNAAHLGRDLGVARGTIHRDLARLRDEFKAPVIYDPSAGAFYYGHPFRPDLPDLPVEEALELGRLLQRSCRLAGTALAASLLRHHDRLLPFLPAADGPRGADADAAAPAATARPRGGADPSPGQTRGRSTSHHRLGRFVRPVHGRTGDPVAVRLRFDAAAGDRLLRGGFLLREDVQLLTDGGLEASVTTRDPDALLLELLRWAPHFEIAAPAWIRRRLPTLLRSLLRYWERGKPPSPSAARPSRPTRRGPGRPGKPPTPKKRSSRAGR